jgi:glucosylceramidase
MKKYFMAFSKKIFLGIIITSFLCSTCKKDKSTITTENPTTVSFTGEAWVTTGDANILLQPQSPLNFTANSNNNITIDIDTTTRYQSIDGFGYTLTGSSALLINSMSTVAKNALLNELFNTDIGGNAVSYLRISIGASDLSPSVFTCNDLPTGQTDISLNNFTLSQDTLHLIPLLQQILTINPSIKILGSPWTPPSWMKTNNSSIGGSLQLQYYNVYANYFVKYIQKMKTKGINIDAITIQNEPETNANNPSMLMTATEQASFIKNNLATAFAAANITTKIILYDHNCDHPSYPITILNDATAKQYVDGSAFHLYAGNINALSTVHNAHPDKNIYFTEQYTSSTGDFAVDLKFHIKNVIIGSMRNWSKNALEWNLANDPNFGLYTPGGCNVCKGAVTINGSTVQSRNVSYYIVAHASKFVPPNSIRVASNEPTNLSNVAFIRPDGKKVLLVLNDGQTSSTFNIKHKGAIGIVTLPAAGVGTYIW